MKQVLAGMAVLVMVSGSVWASLTVLDSASFTNKYEGDVWPSPDYPLSAGTATTDGEILSYTASGSVYAETTTGIPQSYTIEFKLKIDSQAAGAMGVFDVWISNAADPAGTVFLFVGQDAVKVAHFTPTAVYDLAGSYPSDNDFHIYRIAHEAGTTVFQVWRDGFRIGTDVPTSNYPYSDDMWWLGGAGVVGGTGQVDYYRWTAGAYRPLERVNVQGHVTLDGFRGDRSTVRVNVVLTPVGSGETISRNVDLNTDGVFGLDGVTEGEYRVTVKAYASLAATRTVTIGSDATDLGTFDLRGGDSNGDDQVSFEDFSILQNNYGQGSGTAAGASAAATSGCGALGVLLLSGMGWAFSRLGLRRDE